MTVLKAPLVKSRDSTSRYLEIESIRNGGCRESEPRTGNRDTLKDSRVQAVSENIALVIPTMSLYNKGLRI